MDPAPQSQRDLAPGASGEPALARDPSVSGSEGRQGQEEPGGAWRGPDRRQRPTPRISRWSFGRGRRAQIRRGEERVGGFVDRYPLGLLLLCGWVALMNVADSTFTLVHLQAGGRELNPVADWMLMSGRIGFVVLKSTLIALALLVLCVHTHFPLARFGLWMAALAYTVLCGYHLSLFRVA